MSAASRSSTGDTRVRVSNLVEAFVKALAPVPRRALRSAINGLSAGRGDLCPLEGHLVGWHRLRGQSFRVIYCENWRQGTRTVDCVYANRRTIVYELFKELVKSQLWEDPS